MTDTDYLLGLLDFAHIHPLIRRAIIALFLIGGFGGGIWFHFHALRFIPQ
jgi:hypothetical protein